MKLAPLNPPRILALARTLALAALVLPTAGCDHGGGSAAASLTTASRTGSLPRFAELREVRHTGTRKVELFDRSVEPARYLAYREKVASDGAGRFELTPLEPLTRVAPDWPTFQFLQQSRARFLVRYRDFAVRDQSLFLRNYEIRDLARVETIAGRSASLYLVRRADGSHGFELAVDDETDLVLRARELDGDGQTSSQVTYESIDLAPSFDAVVFHRSTIDETEEPLGEGLEEAFGTPVLVPRLLPAGYELRHASTLIDDEGERWAKLTFTDGVETLFFAQFLPAEGDAIAQRPPQGDELVVSRMGSVVTASGRIGPRRLLVLGKVGERALLDLVESSLP